MTSYSASCSFLCSSLRLSRTPLLITAGSRHQRDSPDGVEADAEDDVEADVETAGGVEDDQCGGVSPGIR